MEIQAANGTKIFVVEKEGNDITSALQKAKEYFDTEDITLIQDHVGALDANTILDHSKFFYIAKFS